MALPSRVLNSGVTSLSTIAICGEGAPTVAAAGSTSSDATSLTSIYNRVTTVSAGQGVIMPGCEMGATIYVANSGTNLLKVYPASGATISGASSYSVAPGSCVCFWAPSNTLWLPHQGFEGTQYQPAYGSFLSTVTQTAAVINTAYAATLNTTVENYLVTIGSPASRIVCGVKGVYNFQFSMQLDKTAAATAHVYIWYRINGVDVANSGSQFAINSSDAETVAAWNFIHSMNANDYFELMWAVNDTNVFMPSFPAAAPVPLIPSLILTAQQIR